MYRSFSVAVLHGTDGCSDVEGGRAVEVVVLWSSCNFCPMIAMTFNLGFVMGLYGLKLTVWTTFRPLYTLHCPIFLSSQRNTPILQSIDDTSVTAPFPTFVTLHFTEKHHYSTSSNRLSFYHLIPSVELLSCLIRIHPFGRYEKGWHHSVGYLLGEQASMQGIDGTLRSRFAESRVLVTLALTHRLGFWT